MTGIKILVNCALPYANSSLHLGHIAGAYLGADIFVRFHRMQGDEVLFVSGTDEYGTPITLQADRLGIDPKTIVDRYHSEIDEDFKKIQINFDIFGRTTDEEHHRTVKELFLDLYDKGYIVPGTMISPYCPTCARFMPDRYIIGKCPYCGYERARGDQCENCSKLLDPQDLIDPRCDISGDTPEFRETKHLFFRLNAFEHKLSEWLGEKTFWKKNVVEYSRRFVESGLKERPITRDIEWGVPVPVKGYEDKRVYVWFEALMGYISASRKYSLEIGERDFWMKFWKDKACRVYYFLGKDNIPFHTIIFPAMLMGIGEYNLPYDVLGNEYLNDNGRKFSKSSGIGFTVREAVSKIDPGYLRYYLSSILPETGDAEFSETEMVEKVNSELIGKFGNLVQRSVTFIQNNDLRVHPGKDPKYANVIQYCSEKLSEYCSQMEKVELKKALHVWLDLVQFGNQHINDSAPWHILKTDRDACESIMFTVLRIIQYAAVMLYPFAPDLSERAWKAIGLSDIKSSGMESIKKDDTVFIPRLDGVLFAKVENQFLNENSLDLRIGRIVDAREHPSADRLYILRVHFPDTDIQLVAGLRKYYAVNELVGRRIVVVRNLKHAKIRGEISEGMLLAADDGKNVSFLTVDDDIPEGSPVTMGNNPYNGEEKVDIDSLGKFNLSIGRVDGVRCATSIIGGKPLPLLCLGKPVKPEKDMPEGSKIR